MKDFEQFEELIEAHPDPYTHISEKEFKARLEAAKASLDQPHTLLEFYRKLASTLALIKDGHSSVYLPRFWMQGQRKDRGALPFEVHLTNSDELYVVKSYRKSGIPKGAKIIAINGISVDSFIRKIDPYISYERKNFRNTIIDNRFEECLYLAFGISERTTMDYFTSDTFSTELQLIPYREWKSFQKNIQEEREIKIANGEPYAYKKLNKGVGMLNIYAFTAFDFDAYRIFLLKTFKKIKQDGIHSLIIDVRGNFGGNPKVASRLFHYISEGHFKTMGRSSMKVSSAYRTYWFDRYPALRVHQPTIPKHRHFVDIKAIIDNPIGSYTHEDKLYNEKPQTEEFEFTGDCYLMINRDSYSAASSFASTFQCYQMGTLIGEETGGTKIFRANAFGKELSKSDLRVYVSTTIRFTACYNQELEGVKPTVEFSPSILDICSGTDTQLLYTQRLIKKIRKKKAQAR